MARRNGQAAVESAAGDPGAVLTGASKGQAWTHHFAPAAPRGGGGGATPRFWMPTTPPTNCWPERGSMVGADRLNVPAIDTFSH